MPTPLIGSNRAGETLYQALINAGVHRADAPLAANWYIDALWPDLLAGSSASDR
jgi:hypothetical protein